jgi:hypothetical protein
MRAAPSRRIVAALGVIAVAVVIVGIVAIATRGSGGANHVTHPPIAPTQPIRGTSAADASATANGYYQALKAGNVRAAYALLCPRQQGGLVEYAAQVEIDRETGTAIASFELSGTPTISATGASVPAHVALADGESLPITVLLEMEAGTWRVCSSNLGGVLPAPGPSLGGTPAPPPGGTPSASPSVDTSI